MSDGDTPLLEDLNVRTIRAKNDGVDEELTEKEEEIAELRQELAEKEQQIESLESEKETAKKLLEKFRDDQQSQHIQRIKQANEVVDDGDEFDVSALEEADIGVLETVADRMEKLAEAASSSGGVSNASNSPNLGDVDPDDVNGSPDDDMAKVAEQMNMGSAYEKLQNDEFAGPSSIGTSNETNSTEEAVRQILEDTGAGGAN